MDFDSYDPKPLYRKFERLIGEGEVGGKAKGIAFSYEVITGSDLGKHVTLPDINYVLTTEVFDDFVKDNGIDRILENETLCRPGEGDENSQEVLERLTQAFYKGIFRESLISDIERIIRNIGDYPLAIRSSSLLEDSKMLSFAGKYYTCFSTNVGDVESRVLKITGCIRNVWASLYNPAARAYRAKHGFCDRDEAMGIVIEPVAGKRYNNLYYPEIAGITFSKVYRRPSTRIRKEDGVTRLCFGMGTNSVDRLKARLFYLSHPSLRPQGNLPIEVCQTSQNVFDYFDLSNGQFLTGNISDFLPFILKHHPLAASFIEIFAENALHWAGSEKARHGGKPIFSFSSFPQRHPFFFNLQKELSTYLEDAMGIPVDFEFTYDTSEEKLCLLQLRPLAAFEEMAQVNLPEVKESSLILKGNRMVSNGVLENVSHLVYIDPSVYGKDSKYYEIAREVGRVNDSLEGSKYILVGPGRWGSTNPLLGVPVKYNEICHCGCLVEVGISESDFVPELSYGTHFFLDLDVDGILYLPVFDGEKGDVFNREWLDNTPYEECRHPAVRIYQGNFSVFLDGEKEIGIVFTS